jgi:hypothetical protein
MAAPKGHPRYGGRAKGTPNKATADIKAIAQKMTPEATLRLKQLIASENESVALGAVKEVYDRAYGKATQLVAGDDSADPLRHMIEVAFVAATNRNS